MWYKRTKSHKIPWNTVKNSYIVATLESVDIRAYSLCWRVFGVVWGSILWWILQYSRYWTRLINSGGYKTLKPDCTIFAKIVSNNIPLFFLDFRQSRHNFFKRRSISPGQIWDKKIVPLNRDIDICVAHHLRHPWYLIPCCNVECGERVPHIPLGPDF